jgi:ankyrin repeat protein
MSEKEKQVPHDAVDHPDLYEACRKDDHELAALLIEKAGEGGHDLASYWGHAEGKGRKLPIHEACEAGARKVVDVLLEHLHPEAVNAVAEEEMMTPLHYACRSGDHATAWEVMLRLHEGMIGPDALQQEGGVRETVSEEGDEERWMLGITPVHFAFISGNDKLLQMIMHWQLG